MIVLFTDFGYRGPYVGQMEAVIRQQLADTALIHLMHDAPRTMPVPSSYLLAAFRHSFPAGSVFLAVVDPGVGSERKGVVVKAGEQYFVGPDNGLFNTLAVQCGHSQWWEITWQPEPCSQTFHGRDIFAPVAASLAKGTADAMLKAMPVADLSNCSADLYQVIYFDDYGNAMTGVRYAEHLKGRQLCIHEHVLEQADSFSSVPEGHAFWYCNSSGLVEIALNQGRAESLRGVELGSVLQFQ